MNLRDAKDRASALQAKGRYRQAAELWLQIIVSEPDDPRLRMRYAEACRRSGERRAAVSSWRAAARLFERVGQDGPAHAALRVALEAVRDDAELVPILREELAGLEARRAQREQRSSTSGPLPLLFGTAVAS